MIAYFGGLGYCLTVILIIFADYFKLQRNRRQMAFIIDWDFNET